MRRAHRSRQLGLTLGRYGFTPLHTMIIIIVLSSFLSPATLAQPAPCPAEYPYDPAVGTCVDPETGEPVDPTTGEPLNPGDTVEPTEEPTVAVPEGDLASFTIYHLACDDDFDPDGVRDGGGLGPGNGCLTYGKPPFTYTVSANGTVITTSTIEGGERNFARFDVPGPIPAGSLTISVAPVTDYTTEFMSCGLSVGGGPTDVIEPPVAGGAATLSTLPDQDVECWVYNVTRVAQSTGGGSVNMAFFSAACPADAVINADIDRFCTDGLVDVTYEILSGTETLASNATDGNGVLLFENVPDGQLTILESVPDGFGELYVVCTHYSPTNGDREYAPTIESGTGFTVAVAPGDDLNCTWYNFPAGAGEEAAGDTNEEEDGEGNQGVFADPGESTATGITISTYYCPAGTVATDDLVAACDQRASGLTFSLLTETETVASLTTDAAGDVYFADVAPNTYGIALTLPAGYGEPIVMCYHAFANGGVEEGAEEIVFGNQFRFTVFGDGESVECAWYNVPAQGADTGPNIFIEARTCNPGTSITTSMDVFDAQAVCPFFYVDLAFQVLNVDQLIATGRTNVEASSAGQVFFTKLPEPDSGAFGVTAGVREGERTLAVFCDQDFGDGTFQIVPVRVSGDRMDQETGMGAGDTLRCTWFIEMNPMMLGTHAPDAPAQGDTTQDQAAEDETAPEDTGNEAEPNIPAEQDAADPDETLVEPQEDETSLADNTGEGDAESESATEAETGLTVLALRCPPEVAGSDVILGELCTEPASGLTFEILVDGESTGTYLTDADGDLGIPADAAPGMYLFRHQPAADLLELRTDCASVYPDGATATAQSTAVGSEMGEIYLTYDGASRVTCNFYFVMDSAAAQTGDSPAESEDPATEGESQADDENAGAAHSFTLQFWTCPDGIDTAADQAELVLVCSVEAGERSFMLTIDGVTTGETITGVSTWEFLDPTVYADIGFVPAASAWCESSWTGGDESAAETQDTILLEGGVLTVTVTHPATTVSCDWFIFPG